MSSEGINLRIMHLNCRGINSKLGEIKRLVSKISPHVVCVSETWINRREPKFPDYKIIWNHRVDQVGGGLGIFIHRSVKFARLKVDAHRGGQLEFLGVQVALKNNETLNILNIYNPSKNITLLELRHYIEQLGTSYAIVGDFNAHSLVLDSKDTISNTTGRNLEDLLFNSEVCLINPPNFYTYTCPTNGRKSCLDLCLSSPDISSFLKVRLLKDVGSDHLPLLIETELEAEKNKIVSRHRWHLNSEGLARFKKTINTSGIQHPISTLELTDDFTHRLYNTADNCLRIKDGKIARKHTLWWDAECRSVVQQRRKWRRIFERHPNEQNKIRYIEASNTARRICHRKKKRVI